MKLISHQKPPKPYDFNPINPINSPSPALGPADRLSLGSDRVPLIEKDILYK
ncbi:hypothetical protein HanHA300_Chr01g0029211 [Helianthus annuus]|nr:hypothetical protein HanHA300_Chr01g0029211 [Helianthus annuus]KAJ0627946.1 hypothetical protein HanHA89_Chr01g0031421 [Helianthus annuus]KAJ0784237.1 hypothetical protein HanLR1_Chr01g0029941 [Helianthus annuus]